MKMRGALVLLTAPLTFSGTAAARFEFGDRERRNWHFTPRGREGLMIGDMTPAQKDATAALLRATL